MSTFDVLLQEYLDGQEVPIWDFLIDHPEHIQDVVQARNVCRDSIYTFSLEYGWWDDKRRARVQVKIEHMWRRKNLLQALLDAFNGVPNVTPF